MHSCGAHTLASLVQFIEKGKVMIKHCFTKKKMKSIVKYKVERASTTKSTVKGWLLQLYCLLIVTVVYGPIETQFFVCLSVSMQSVRVINGTLGHTAILPCSTSQLNVNVYWRYNDSITVCDILSGRLDFDEQYQAYRSRVESFPTEIPKGNFSIKLHSLRKSDTGIYTCNIPNTPTQGPVYLRVTGVCTTCFSNSVSEIIIHYFYYYY